MKKRAYPNECPKLSRRVHFVAITVGLALASLGCSSEGEVFNVDGTWTGLVALVTEPDVQISLVLTRQGKNGITGSAQVAVPPEGQAVGAVRGTRKGKDVNFTIDLDDVMVPGTLVFEGAFESDDVISGTIDSGLLGGSQPITFQR